MTLVYYCYVDGQACLRQQRDYNSRINVYKLGYSWEKSRKYNNNIITILFTRVWNRGSRIQTKITEG